MGRKRTLADELADLATTAPTTEVDVDRDELGDDALLVESDDEAQQKSRQKRTKRAPEKGLRLRAGIQLEDDTYAGRRTLRSAVFGDSEGSEDDSGGDLSVEHSDEENMHVDQKSSGKDYEEEDEGDSEGPASDQPGDSRSEGSQSEDDKEAQYLPQLEDPYAEEHASEAAAAAQLKARLTKEQERSTAARAQRAIWERLLEVRILLQKVLVASHRLPPPDTTASIRDSNGALADGFKSAEQESLAVLDELFQLHNSLVSQNPEIATEQKGGAAGDSAEAGWRRLEQSYAQIASFRDESLDRWYRKTLLGNGLALNSSLRMLNQSISGQVANAMRDSSRLLPRVQLPLDAAPRQLCAGPQAASPQGLGGGANPASDPERFDDSEFYQQLLKEFLQSNSSAAELGTKSLTRGRKSKAMADRRASKGRRLRFDVQEKLVNFMVAAKFEEPPMASQLFRNLFGQKLELSTGATASE